ELWMLPDLRVPDAGAGNGGDRPAGHPGDRVEGVDADVVDRPAVHPRLEVPRRSAAVEQRVLGGESDGVHLADGPLADEPPDGADRAAAAHVQQAADPQPALAAERLDLLQ